MNSSKEILSVSEFASILKQINNCKGKATDTGDDGVVIEICDCCMQCLCDSCIDKLAGLLEWAEDFEPEEEFIARTPNCS